MTMGLDRLVQSLKKKLRKKFDLLKGKEQKDKVFCSSRKFNTLLDAREAFSRAKGKLFDVNQWSKMPGITSSFELFDAQGRRKIEKSVAVGDYILIKIPGPLPENWVEIISLTDQEDWAEFIVSPSDNPTERIYKDERVNHFFKDTATSTFRVKREADSLFAYEIGKDETINNTGTQAANRKWINTLMAEGGWLGFQRIQWKNLTEYMVHHSEMENGEE